jgi:hypothetical protein
MERTKLKRRRGALLTAVMVLAVMALALCPSPAEASTLLFNLDNVFSGNTPNSSSPYAIATFRDGADCLGGTCAANTVQLVLQASLEDSSEFITEWDFNSSVITGLSLAFDATNSANSGSYTTSGVIQPVSSNAYKADGDGFYDISFQFDSGMGSSARFDGTDTAVVTITGTGITASTFNELSSPGGGAGPFHTAAHIQGITPSCSGWVSDTVAGSSGSSDGPCGPTTRTAPEPSSLLALGPGLIALGLIRRKLMRK